MGFEDEVWWSRLARPGLHAWTDAEGPLRLVEQSVPQNDRDPKALACYGLLVRWVTTERQVRQEVWLRFVDGQPVSGVTTAFLEWACTKLETLGKKALLLVWDNASWHVSNQVRNWIKRSNRQVRATGRGVRIVSCYLPIKSPWLNPIEPMWVHGKRRVAEAGGLLTAYQLARRVCHTFRCQYEEHLAIAQKVS